MLQLLQNAKNHAARRAILSNGQSYTYTDLLNPSENVAANLLNEAQDFAEERIAFIVPPSFEYTVVQWWIWQAGGIAVPLF